jgi:AbiV family abortive infection protein
MTSKTLSKYKWKRLATESLLNALRLHKDSVTLFKVGSYPSAYQLSVLCLEEFAKAKWVEHYYYSCITNTGFPHADFEQGFLKLLYLHGEKQYGFIARDLFEYPPEFADFIKGGGLDRRKQQATYVGLKKTRKEVDVGGRISVPRTIGMKEARRIISWINAEFLFVHKNLKYHENYFGIEEMDTAMLSTAADIIFKWPYKSRLRSRKHQVAHHARHAEEYRIAQQQWLAGRSIASPEEVLKEENARQSE